ncbi:MAG: TIGR04348 family glycosyltransferase [Rhodoferax sp.]|nr:TIGR04348 family glycosyltransferase [Rhodoferax sp.]MCF8210520.1 TIGR04348 family glycosyltransferase [Rhodoferax sp.]
MVIVSPALSDANNGNWQTARRWQGMLAAQHTVRIVRDWAADPAPNDQVMLALHARRSASSVQAWAQAHGSAGLAVVLTGTDLYRDIAVDVQAQQSLDLAQRLVVLQEQGPLAVPSHWRKKTEVIVQSVPTRQTHRKTTRHLRALMVGHLRAEKDPLTLFAAAQLLDTEPTILIDHIGAPLEDALGQAALDTSRHHRHYRWLGEQDHEATLRRIQGAHVLVHASRMEGGAHVVMEAVCSGTPVLASRIPGNVGMLGTDYAGYFEVGDAQGLARLLRQCRDELVQAGSEATPAEPAGAGGLLSQLQRQCVLRAPLFSPVRERAALLALVDALAAA